MNSFIKINKNTLPKQGKSRTIAQEGAVFLIGSQIPLIKNNTNEFKCELRICRVKRNLV